MGVGEGAAVARKPAGDAVVGDAVGAEEEAWAGEDALWDAAWEAAPIVEAGNPAAALDEEEDWTTLPPVFVETAADVRRVQRGIQPLPPRHLGKMGRRRWNGAMGTEWGQKELRRVGQRVNGADMRGEEALAFIFSRLSLERLERKIKM